MIMSHIIAESMEPVWSNDPISPNGKSGPRRWITSDVYRLMYWNNPDKLIINWVGNNHLYLPLNWTIV